MRRLPAVLLSTALAAPLAVALPVTTPATARPHPVQPAVRSVPVTTADAAPAQGVARPDTAAPGGPVLQTPQQATAAFQTIGATWQAGTLRPDSQVQVRTRSAGTWSDWQPLSPIDTGADRGSADGRSAAARHGGTEMAEPLWAGHADGVQARVVGTAGHPGHAPARLSVVLVDAGSSAADTTPGGATPAASAFAAEPQPAIYSRADWGADESLRTYNPGCGTPDYADTIRVGFVHHTDTPNGYAAGDVPAIIRGIYAYHVETNGWCDIGYNFLVDRFGRLWEGRYGGIDKPVIGAHTGGFNTRSFGVSMIGTYDTLAPAGATVSALQHLFAWKLDSNYRDPRGTETLTAGSFDAQRYPQGSQVQFNAVSGHRDADYTSCPGDAGYAILQSIRNGAAALVGLGLVDPSVSLPPSGGPGTFSFGLTQPASWTFTVRAADGTVLRQLAGSSSGPVNGTWDGRDSSGRLLPDGHYTITIGAANGNGTAWPYTTPYLRTDSTDLVGVARDGTSSGRVEVHTLSHASGWQQFSTHAATALPVVSDPANWRFIAAPFAGDQANDLYMIHMAGTASGQVEVHVLSEASGYSSFLAHVATPLAAVSPDQWQFQLASFAGDRAADLFAVRNAGGASGMVEVHVLSAATNYHGWLDHAATALTPTTAGTWDYLVGDGAGAGDLVAVSRLGTGSGHAEVHVLSQASNYHTFTLHRATPLAPVPQPSAQFSLGDVDADGMPDLALTLMQNTGSNTTELHVLSGATGFDSWLLHTPTGLGTTNPLIWDVRLPA